MNFCVQVLYREASREVAVWKHQATCLVLRSRCSSHSKLYIRHHIILQTAAKFLSRLDVKLHRERPIASALDQPAVFGEFGGVVIVHSTSRFAKTFKMFLSPLGLWTAVRKHTSPET